VLRGSRRLLRPGGRTAFFTIYPASGLDAGQRRRASRDGPSAVATARTHTELLDAAGFTDINETDYTAEFADITRTWIEQWDAHHDELASLLGPQAVADRQVERRGQLRAIQDGILRRALFSARRP
jgi:hypothetical protein